VYKVNGDSMVPTFHDGDLVFVEDIPNGAPLHFGEIGAFAIGNETYIKEYQQDGLHSHNPHYPVMRFEEDAGVLLIGRVLGVVEPDQLATESEKTRFLRKKRAEE
jgi:phage repressor protein C with HTH and peptisase S24 domain